MNPLRPPYLAGNIQLASSATPPLTWCEFRGGVYWIGQEEQGFAFDNERPAHRVYVEKYRIATRLVTNGEYRDFVADGGYRRPELWLAAGWVAVQEQKLASPIYWEYTPDGWTEFTLEGMQHLDPDAPVNHVNYYEADAYARWAGA